MIFCRYCQRQVNPKITRKRFSFMGFLIGGFLTGGLFAVIYLIWYLAAPPSKNCPVCNCKF